MKMFSSVAILTDHTMVEDADALRGVFESFSLRVHFHRLVQKPQVLSFFEQDDEYPYTVIVTHGSHRPPDDPHIALQVVDQREEKYEETEGWSPVTVKVTPTFVKENIRGRFGTLVSLACGSGHQSLAEAFIGAGYESYIAPVEPYYNSQAAIVFVTSLFYLLLSEDRDYAEHVYSEEEAVRAAARIDTDFPYGPTAFRRYTKRGYDFDEK